MKTRNSHGLLQLGREALAYCQFASALISGNKALFVSVDLIGEKNQVILELSINTSNSSKQILTSARTGKAQHKTNYVDNKKRDNRFVFTSTLSTEMPIIKYKKGKLHVLSYLSSNSIFQIHPQNTCINWSTTRVVREDNIARRRQPCVNSNNK